MKLSLVVPAYNEEEMIDLFLEATEPIVAATGLEYEFVFVNDGSQDNTLNLLRERAQTNKHIRVVDLARNFGKEAALTAGLKVATGDAVIPMDCDLQDPPELITEFVRLWREEGYDVVYGERRLRDTDGFLKRNLALGFYRIFNMIAETKIPFNTGDYRLMDRKVVDAVLSLPENTRFMKGLFAWVGFRQTAVLYDRPERAAGDTKWASAGLWRLAFDGITSFSTAPLRVSLYVGVLISVLSFLYATYIVANTLITGVDVPGYASQLTIILFLGGIQLLSLGLIGEYVGRLYMEAKRRPIYLIRSVEGGEESAGDDAKDA